MRGIVVLAILGAAGVMTPALARAQSPAPSATPAAAATPRPKLSEVTPMSEDMRVNADAIDSVMVNPRIFFLDVREPKEIAETGSYEGYVNIPMGQLESRLGELPRDRPILTACSAGGRASRAAALLEKNGFQVTGFCGLKDYKGAKVKPARKSDK
jgi:rhodanese-related sulfurtransferase